MNEAEERTYRELIVTKLDGIHYKIEIMDGREEEILKEAKHTNSRVSSLERWRSYMIGAGTILIILTVSVLIPVMDAFIKRGTLF